MKGTDDIDPNHGDYFTKHHSTIHHKGVRHSYINDKLACMIAPSLTHLVTKLRECLDPHSSTGYQLTNKTLTQSFNIVNK